MFKKFFIWLRMRRLHSGIDMVVTSHAGERLLIPVSNKAKQAMQERFGNQLKRAVGGYLIPGASWRQTYDELHHGPCPIAAWI